MLKVVHNGDYGKSIRKLMKNMSVIAGLPKGSGSYQDGISIVEVGAINEFGTNKIPARSFVRVPIQNAKKSIFKLVALESKKLYSLKSSVSISLETIGIMMSDKMKESFTNNNWKENAPYTVEKKGSSTPLINSGQLRQSITFEVRKK